MRRTKHLLTNVAVAVGLMICVAPAQADGFPNNPEARNLVQQSAEHLRNKEFTKAREVLERALQIEPSSGLIHFRLGLAYSELGNNEAALKEYFTSLELQPHIAVAKYNIGNCYQGLGDLDKAREWFEKYVREEPGDKLVQMAQQRIEALKRVADKFKAANKDGPDYFDTLVGGDRGPERWTQEKMPLKIFIDTGGTIKDFPKEYPALLYESLQSWVQATDGRISIVTVPNANQADIYCDWTTDAKELKANATGAESGHTDVEWAMSRKDPTRTRRLAKARVRILITDAKGRAIDADPLKKTCLHELGHALGIDGHSGNPRDIMFFGESTSCLPALSKRDKATIQKLYADQTPVEQ